MRKNDRKKVNTVNKTNRNKDPLERHINNNNNTRLSERTRRKGAVT